MAIGKHLVQRGKQGRFYLRLAVPRALQSRWGKRERIKGLGTSDRSHAERLALPILATWRAEEQAALGQGTPGVPTRRVPSDVELEEAAVAMHDIIRDEQAGVRQLHRGWDAGLWKMHLTDLAGEVERQEQQTATGDFTLVAGLADEIAGALDFDLDPGSDRYRKLCELLNITRLSALRSSHSQAQGNIETEIVSPLVARVRERDAAKAKPGETIAELFELWAAEALEIGDKREDTVNQDRKAIAQFAAFIGVDRDIRSITPVEVAEYRDTMKSLPPKWMSKKELRGLGMRAAAAVAREKGMPKMAFTNVNKHLSTISPLYTWLAGQPKWAGLRNPCDNLHYPRVKGRNSRPSFSTETLNKILKSPLYTGFLADGDEHLPGNQHADDWRYWIPLICMFTGARIGEIAQLRVGDVRKERGVWFIHIRHEEAEGLATKSGKSRAAAVHPMLERLGFLAFLAKVAGRVGDDLSAPLFEGIDPNKRGQISGTPSRWWRDYLVGIKVKDATVQGGDGLGAHSFRHTLADRYRSEAELLDTEIAVALGHNQKTTTSGYGELAQGTVTMFKGWMEAVRFDGVDFSHLIPASAG